MGSMEEAMTHRARIGIGLLLAFSVLITAPVAAQEEGESPGTTTYDFEDDVVTGDLVRPDGELLSVRRRGSRASLISIREHFVPEMLKSVEDL